MSKKVSVFQRINSVPYGYTNAFQLFDATKNSKDIVQRLRLQVKIPAHNGCVNSICWNESGKLLLSGSDDEHLSITDAYSHSILSYVPTGHRSNIFSAKFLPNTGDCKVVSCSGDGVIIFSDLEVPETSIQNKMNCHFGTAYEIMTIPNDPNTFLSCGEDGTVRWYDVRIKTTCVKDNCKEDILIKSNTGVTSLAINPILPYQLAIGCADSSVRVFDRRMLGTDATGGSQEKKGSAVLANFTSPQFSHSTFRRRITSLGYSRDGQEMLVSYSSDFVYLFDLRNSFLGSKDAKVLTVSEKLKKKSGRSVSPRRPLMKRLRVRGDWSDTGPQARPESESRTGDNPRTLHANLMQRMSDVLTCVYNHRARQQNSITDPSSSTSHSDGSDDSDENRNADLGERHDSDNVAANNDIVESSAHIQIEPSQIQTNETVAADTVIERTPNEQPVDFEPPGDLSELSFATIQVNSTSSLDIESDMEVESSEASGNMSLQNIKKEMALKTQSNLGNVQSVTCEEVKTDSDCDTKVLPSSAPNHIETFGAMNGSDPHLESQSTSCNKSTTNVCDKESSSDSSSNNPSTDAFNVSNTSSSDKPQSSQNIMCDITNETECEHQNQNKPDVTISQAGSESQENEDESPQLNNAPSQRSTASARFQSIAERLRQQRTVAEMEAIMSNGEVEEEEDEDDENNPLIHPEVLQRYVGHRNARTMIKESTFWGDNFVMSGSDCGHIFMWDRYSSELVMLMEADHHVVNCLQPHPFDPILASSGIDYDIKIWAPLREEPFFDEEKALEIMTRNKVMLEETKDTITVPASFMIRMLASLNNMTSGTGWRRIARQLREEYHNRR